MRRFTSMLLPMGFKMGSSHFVFPRFVGALIPMLQLHQSFFCLLVVIVGSIICASPLFSISGRYSYELFSISVGESSPLLRSLYSARVSTSFMVAILVSAPLFAESVIDGYSSLSFSRLSQYFVCSRQSGGLADGSTSNFDPRHWAVRVGLLAALTIPHIKYLALENVVTDNKASAFDLGHFFLCSFYFRGVATVGSLLVFVSSREMEVIGSGWMCIMASLTYVAGQILRLNAVGHRENRTALHMSIASTCLLFIAFAQLIFIGLIWVLKSVLRPYLECRSFSNVKGDQFTTLTYIGAILLMAIGSFAIEITEVGIQGSLLDASPDCLEALIYLQVAFTVIIVLTPQYAARRDLDDARAALEGKKTFLQYISHEIRTPLNTVTMGLTCMREDVEELTDKIRPDQLDAQQAVRTMGDTLGDVESSCQAALTILNELLMSDKMESGKLQLEAEHCPPWAIFLETIRPFYVQARQKNIALTLDCVGRNMNGDVIAGSRVQSDLDKFLVYVDKNKIAQVVRNLLSNALKFTPEGRSVKVLMKRIPPPSSDDPASALYGGAVAVPVRIMPEDLQAPSSRTLQAEENSFLRVEVVDNGAGISAKNQKNLFKKYAQFDAAKLQKGGGTGLGLWISRGIVELHGGRIGAYSEGEGKGCTFFVELPLIAKKVLEARAREKERANSKQDGPSFRRLAAAVVGISPTGSRPETRPRTRVGSALNSKRIVISPQVLPVRTVAQVPVVAAASNDVSFRNLAHHVFDRNSMAIGSAMASGLHTPQRRGDRPFLPIGYKKSFDGDNGFGAVRSAETSVRSGGGGRRASHWGILSPGGLSNSRKKGLATGLSSPLQTINAFAADGEEKDANALQLGSVQNNPQLDRDRGDQSKSSSSGNQQQSNPISKHSNKSSFDRWSTPSPGQLPTRDVILKGGKSGGAADEDSGSFRDANGIHLQRHSRMTSFVDRPKPRSFSRNQNQNIANDKTSSGGAAAAAQSVDTPGDSWVHASSADAGDVDPNLAAMLQRHSRAPSGNRFGRPQQQQQQQLLRPGEVVGSNTNTDDAPPPSVSPAIESNILRATESSISMAVQRQFRSPVAAVSSDFLARERQRLGPILSDISEGESRESTTHITPSSRFMTPRTISAAPSSRHLNIGPLERQMSARKNERSGQTPAVGDNDTVPNTLTSSARSPAFEATSDGKETSTIQATLSNDSSALTILIVDDSTSNRKMVRRLLRHVAGDLLEANDGRECLSVLEEAARRGTSIDIILMDDHMPNLSGPETARILRERGYTGLICGVTGNTLPSDIKNFKDHGASCVLSKPLNVELLKYYISQYQTTGPSDGLD